MESAQISGKVFRHLSAMHPSLSKAERKRYAEFDPDTWYPWTSEIAGEFTDLMRRSPRDITFARGLAYAARVGLPEDEKLKATELVGRLAALPAAFQGPDGSGYQVEMEAPGFAIVRYAGMPGFSNVCIAILGELGQRLQDVGARDVDIRHAAGCRLQGGEACTFEVRWSAEPGEQVPAEAKATGVAVAPSSAPASAPRPASSTSTLARPAPAASSRPSAAAAPAAAPAPAASSRSSASTLAASSAASRISPAAPAAAPSGAASTGSATDLFEQLRVRLLDAEQAASRQGELEARVVALEAELDAARTEAASATASLEDLKARLRSLVDDA